jgi:hypothetical protein
MPAQSKKDVGSDALKKISRRIRAMEYNKNIFRSSQIGASKGKRTNIAHFKKHNRVPRGFRLQKKSTSLPISYGVLWEGKMLVGGQIEDVIASRRKGKRTLKRSSPKKK